MNSWITVLGIILGSSLVSAVVSKTWDTVIAKRESDTAVNFLALKLAIVFEDFAVELASKLSNDGLAQSSMDYIGDYIGVSDLNPPQLPEHENYKKISHNLAQRIFEFPRAIEATKDEVRFTVEVADENDAGDKLRKNTISLVREALSIAAELRSQHKLPQREIYTGIYKVEDYLKKLEGENSQNDQSYSKSLKERILKMIRPKAFTKI